MVYIFVNGLFMGSELCYLCKSSLKVQCFFKGFPRAAKHFLYNLLLSHTSRWKQEQSYCVLHFPRILAYSVDNLSMTQSIFMVYPLIAFLQQLYCVGTFSWLLYYVIYLVSWAELNSHSRTNLDFFIAFLSHWFSSYNMYTLL